MAFLRLIAVFRTTCCLNSNLARQATVQALCTRRLPAIMVIDSHCWCIDRFDTPRCDEDVPNEEFRRSFLYQPIHQHRVESFSDKLLAGTARPRRKHFPSRANPIFTFLVSFLPRAHLGEKHTPTHTHTLRAAFAEGSLSILIPISSAAG